MSNNSEPLIKLEPGGRATILSYNVPEPASYSGRNFIALDFPQGQDIFKPPSITTGSSGTDTGSSSTTAGSAGSYSAVALRESDPAGSGRKLLTP